ncbi:MAG: P1 family peptidase [Actinomycetota bacterium]|nr:P1 family peptidase [Actinomycetota bacterium]
MPRARDLGIIIGPLAPGATNSMLDVPGVGVGHATVWRDEPDPPDGRGVARTGVTVVDPGGSPFRSPVPFGSAVLNGAGEMTGLTTGREWGLLESTIALTSTMQLGRVYDAVCELMLEADDLIAEDVVIPAVGECDDSFLNDVRRMQVDKEDVRSAMAAAATSVGSSVAPAEGAVGSGTGMACLGWKGGIGSSSRRLASGHTVGVLLMANFGEASRLTVDGVPVGRSLRPPEGIAVPGPAGSCIVVVGTDAPVDAAGCERLARRAGLGLARTGSTAHHGSGEIFAAFATGLRAPRGESAAGPPMAGAALDEAFAAVVDATEESVLNAMLQSPTVVGRAGNTLHGLPSDDVVRLLRDAGRLA